MAGIPLGQRLSTSASKAWASSPTILNMAAVNGVVTVRMLVNPALRRMDAGQAR